MPYYMEVKNVAEAAEILKKAVYDVKLPGDYKIGFSVNFSIYNKKKEQVASIYVDPDDIKSEPRIIFHNNN